jgi:hypothetical protein
MKQIEQEFRNNFEGVHTTEQGNDVMVTLDNIWQWIEAKLEEQYQKGREDERAGILKRLENRWDNLTENFPQMNPLSGGVREAINIIKGMKKP